MDIQEQILGIIQKNYNEFLGGNEAELHSSEEIADLFKSYLIQFASELKDYTHESKSILGDDEREPIEFVEIFLKKINGY